MLFQYDTYLSNLTGYPTRKSNAKNISRALNYAKEKLWGCEKPYLIVPVEYRLEIPRNKWISLTEEHEPTKLPAFTCCGTFSSSQKARASDSHYSELSVVWYQDTMALPIASEIIDTIYNIDWSLHAQDCYF